MSNPFTLLSGRGIKLLPFGDEGCGKTDLASGVRKLTTRYLYIDNEGSTSAVSLAAYDKTTHCGLLMLTAQSAQSVTKLLEDGLVAARAGKPWWDVVVLDSFVEQQETRSGQIAVERAKANPKESPQALSEAGWGDLRRDLLTLLRLCVALADTGCGVIVTTAADLEDDPLRPGTKEVRPYCQGSVRFLLGKFFDLVIYVKNDSNKENPSRHLYHMLRVGNFRHKNRYERQWIGLKFPAVLENPDLPQLLYYIHKSD